jgi:chromosomal replication initiator protein
MDARRLWQAVLGELEVTLSSANYRTWFKGTSILSQNDQHVVVAVPNAMTKDWLERKFSHHIIEIFKRIHEDITSIEFKIASSQAGATATAPARDALLAPAPPPQPVFNQTLAPTMSSSRPGRPNSYSKLNHKYNLDAFVVGPSNELAYAACQAVAAYPGEKYNPLFLYGGVGLGKTHLMQAVGNEIVRQDNTKRIRYVTSEEFTREFLDAIRDKKNKSFADLYRNLDVLIVDDIQFLGNKERTQEEFFHTFNTLHQANKQVILSSDKPPRDIPHLEDRLRSRFEMGMVADIQRPDLETRSAIIQSKAATHNVELPIEAVDFLARHYQNNIRELEGALTGILAQCELKGQAPTLSFITSLIGEAAPASRRKLPSPKLIIEKTALHFNIQPDDIIGPRRDKEIVVPRQIAMYLMRQELALSFPKIAQHVGGRDHTTAMHSVAKIEKLIERDPDIRTEVNEVKERITL